MPLAAISSLITLLTHFAPSTTSETLSLLSHHSSLLKTSVRNPIALSAGTDLFQRYIVNTLQSATLPHPSKSHAESKEDMDDGFKRVRDELVANGKMFVERAQEARGVIARTATAKGLVRDGGTVLTCGESRVVSAVLNAAAEKGVRFRVVYVGHSALGSSRASERTRERKGEEEGGGGGGGGGGDGMVKQLRGKGIPVAVIGPSAKAYSLGETTMVMVGAEGVLENGGIVSRMGTYQLAMLAKSVGKPVYVVAESHKFVRLYPLGQYDLPIQQTVLDFSDRADDDDDERSGRQDDETVDYTPPELITALVTETGVHTPSAISEELIKIWY